MNNKTTLENRPRRFGKSTLVENAFLVACEAGESARYESSNYVCLSRKALKDLLASSQKDKEKAVEDLKNEIIETALIEAGKEPDGQELWIKNADDLEKVLNYAFKESLKSKESK